MKFEDLLKVVREFPVIETEQLAHRYASRGALEVQLSRWAKQGKLIQLKRGHYLLAEPYRGIEPYEFYLASLLKRPSYVSLEKALEYHDLIPEGVGVYTSVTTKRPGRFETSVGVFDYQHIQVPFFWGYEAAVVKGQTGFVASPEKGLLDYIYLRYPTLSLEFFDQMRLQNLEKLNLAKLLAYAHRFNKPRMERAAALLKKYARASRGAEKIL